MGAFDARHGASQIDRIRAFHAVILLSAVMNMDLPLRIIRKKSGKAVAYEPMQIKLDLFWFASDADYPLSFARCLSVLNLSHKVEMVRRIIGEMSRQRKGIAARINRGAITGPFARTSNQAGASELEYKVDLFAKTAFLRNQPKWYQALLENVQEQNAASKEYESLEMIACGAITGRTPGPEFFEERYYAHA